MFPASSSVKFSIFSRLLISVLIVSTFALVSGCNKDRDADPGLSASQMYDNAKKYLDAKNWSRATYEYQRLTTRFPFGRYTEQAQLELAYAYHKGGQPKAALSTADRFIRTYPSHPNVDYAFYIRGLTNYEQRIGFMERLMPSRVRDRDQTAARESFRDFSELIRRFPDRSRDGPAPQR